MEALQRARRITWITLIAGLVMLWIFLALGSAVLFGEGRFPWWRAVPAFAAAAGFTWLAWRAIDAVMAGRYPLREVVACAVLAVIGTVAGGGDPFGWGFLIMVWVYTATLRVTKRTAVLQSAGAFVVAVGLGLLGVATDTGVSGADLRLPEAALYFGGIYAVWCLTLPPSGRLWLWIWTLAEQAHQGREAHTRLALAEERLRFARDLHDLVGHQLSAIAVKTELAKRLSEADPAAARAELTEINTLTRKALRELREAVRGYRELDLTAELDSVKGVLEAAGVRCEVRLPYRELPGGLAPDFALAVREAVTNVLKHSAATFCDITIRFTPERAELSVRNDGVARRQADDLGSGLTGMAERLAAVGGAVRARPTGDGEFLLEAVVSLPVRG
ncbi:Sensor histidine kinase DesK [Nonomuraea coxensis DSM 45129]|uniref:Sensor histidine kinase DesK n=1 Tax=Nonomuraea coxensis DSM 45129 TaxID=1122611 RepID=A0ABX8TVF9_9ACTN|nr:histidine kinase [Nonomuraea coxensis]QYC39236.1 Sensor histidine kinase DesK [Nonomuraea coxensis DSM 45129]